jgi:hypothetical protein
MDKSELLSELEDQRQEFLDLLEDVPDEWMLVPDVVGEWSIRDVLAHLTAWEGQTVTLLFQVQHEIAKPTTAHFGKETDDEINKRWHEAGKDRPFGLIWEDWLNVRKQMIRRVSDMSEQELNDPKRYPWMNGNPLTQLILEAVLDHEEEHADHIREWLENRDSKGPAAGNNGHEQI